MSTHPSAVRTALSGGPLVASAWSLVAGGLLFALGNLLHPLEHNLAAFRAPTRVLAHVLIFFSVPFLILGFPALYAALERRASGRLGVAAIVLAVFGLVCMSPGLLVEAFVAPVVGLIVVQQLEAGGFGMISGLLPFLWVVSLFPLAVACYRARLGPRWASIVLVLVSLVLLAAVADRGPAGGAAIIAATAAYGLVIAVLGWHTRDVARNLPRLDLEEGFASRINAGPPAH